MRLAISQSYFFPYIGYFQLINAVDKFILNDWLSYIKKGWIDRNKIAVSATEERFIKMHVEKRSSNKRIKDLTICYDHLWQDKIIRQLKNNYSRSPYFGNLYPFFVDLLKIDCQQVSLYNFKTITAIAHLLDIKTCIISAGDEFLGLENELKTKQWPYDTKIQRIISICQHENADTYINAIGGQKLYSQKIFQEQDIKLLFLRKQEYLNNTIKISNLSIIDILFRHGIDKTKEMLSCYDLIQE